MSVSSTNTITVSPLAAKLWRLLTERGASYTWEEIRTELRTSKTGLLRAVAELEEHNLIISEEE